MTRHSPPSNPSRPEQRQDRLLRERVHDPYQTRKKLVEPTVCPECGALYHAGRWQWGSALAAAQRELCPACQRLHDRCPAGFLTLTGAFLAAHREEILNLLHHVEAREKAEHPLRRLMAVVEEADDRVSATFTDPQLARAVGEAIHDAYQGQLDYDYQDDEFLLRVHWQR
ncbi:BCAM0308 family protein [Candidatus Methylocalor cossyra]|uniref:ATPase n=1 Tax=Candidatus Methylocalor cossyra TaxID=3108543 RepID=A0ABP1C841_9GAMM